MQPTVTMLAAQAQNLLSDDATENAGLYAEDAAMAVPSRTIHDLAAKAAILEHRTEIYCDRVPAFARILREDAERLAGEG